MRQSGALELLNTWHGVGRREDLLRNRVPRAELDRLVATGAVKRVHRGVYATEAAHPHRIVAATLRSLLTCVSAAELWGLASLASDPLTHLVVPASRGFARAGSRPLERAWIHYDRLHKVRHVSDGGQLRLTVSPAVALVHASTCIESEALLVMADSALNKGLLKPDEVASTPGMKSATRSWLLRNMDGRAQSLLETLTRAHLRGLGLAVQPQVVIPGVGRVDLLVENRVVVEVDGREYHSNPQQFAEDRRRDRKLALRGFPVLRYTYDDVIKRRMLIGDEVMRLLADMTAPPPVIPTH